MNDDLSGCLFWLLLGPLIVFIVCALGLWVLGLMIWSLPVWGLGFLAGLIINGIARMKIRMDLESPAMLSRLVTLRFDGSTLSGERDSVAIRNYEQPDNFLTVIACLGTTLVLSLVFFQPGIRSAYVDILQQNFYDRSSVFAVALAGLMPFGLIVTVIMGILCSVFLGKKMNLVQFVETRMDAVVRQANLKFEMADQLRNCMRETAQIAEGLQIVFPREYLTEIQQIVETYRVRIVIDPSILEAEIRNQTERACEDRTRLRQAAVCFEAVMSQYRQVSRAVFAASSPSMWDLLDQLFEQIHQAKETCLPQREWSTFEDAMSLYQEELVLFEQQAGTIGGTRIKMNGSANPHQVLGTSPEMDISEIKRIFRKLCGIYHPDSGMVQDGDKFREIKNAYDEIMKEAKRENI